MIHSHSITRAYYVRSIQLAYTPKSDHGAISPPHPWFQPHLTITPLRAVRSLFAEAAPQIPGCVSVDGKSNDCGTWLSPPNPVHGSVSIGGSPNGSPKTPVSSS